MAEFIANECQHEWLGTDNGVNCLKCGEHLSHEEYVEYLSGGKIPAHSHKKPRKKTEE